MVVRILGVDLVVRQTRSNGGGLRPGGARRVAASRSGSAASFSFGDPLKTPVVRERRWQPSLGDAESLNHTRERTQIERI